MSDVLGEDPREILAPFDAIVIGTTLNPFVAKNGGMVHLTRRAVRPEQGKVAGLPST